MKNTSTAPMSYIYDGRACLGFVLSRGRAGFEAFDREERSLDRRVLVLEIEVWGGRDWQPAVSSGGVAIEIGQLRARALVS
jgi:hypothetical protein